MDSRFDNLYNLIFGKEEAQTRKEPDFSIHDCNLVEHALSRSSRDRRELILQAIERGHEEVLASLRLDEGWQG